MASQHIRRLSTALCLLTVLALSLPVSSSSLPFLSALTFHNSSVMFIENVGQFSDGARFQVRGSTELTWIAEDALWVTLWGPRSVVRGCTSGTGCSDLRSQSAPSPRSGVNVRISFPGANPHPRLEPFDRLDTRFSYFLGNDQTKWRVDVPVWGGVRYKGLYPGIDLEITHTGGQSTQRFVAASGADSSQVRLRIDGAKTLLDLPGQDQQLLPLATDVGRASIALPASDFPYQVEVSIPAKEGSSFTFNPSGDTANQPAEVRKVTGLADNPAELLIGTYLGGAGANNYGWGIDIGGDGSAYVTGQTQSPIFPATPGAFDTDLTGDSDAFVIKLRADGTALDYATYIGGPGGDWGYGIAVDNAGRAYITGYVNGPSFPYTSGSCGNDCSYGSAFIVALSSTGTALIYSTCLGGYSFDTNSGSAGNAIVVDGAGYAWVAGWAGGLFPTTQGAFKGSPTSWTDGFVAKLSPDGSNLLYSTLLGGSLDEHVWDIGIDSEGNAYVAGFTESSDFPITPGVFDPSFAGGYGVADGFITKLNANGEALIYSTFVAGADSPAVQRFYSIAIDSEDHAYFAISDFTNYGNVRVRKLSRTADRLIYNTLLVMSSLLRIRDIAVGVDGSAHVLLDVNGSGFPATAGAYDTSFNGGIDAVLAKFTPNGSLLYGTYLGGRFQECYYDAGCVMTLGEDGTAYVTGHTFSDDFPTTPNAFDTSYNGVDAFVARLAMPPSLSIEYHQIDGSVVLTWWHLAPYSSYELWRDVTPYFDLIAPPATKVSSGLPPTGCTLVDGIITCPLSAGVGDVSTNYFYLVRGVRSDGTGANSNRTGEFDFALVSGN